APEGEAADVDLAVEAAVRTWDSEIWRGLHPSARAKILWRAADLIDAHAQELAELEALNSGMLLPMAYGMMASAAEVPRHYAGFATKIYGLTTDMSTPAQKYHAFTLRDPIGVCGFILPWNVPVMLTVNKLAPALAAGCSCVVKPAEETPLSTLRLVELYHEAG